MSLVRLMDRLGGLDAMEAIARAMYQRTKNPYWKEQVEWLKKAREREIELTMEMLPLS